MKKAFYYIFISFFISIFTLVIYTPNATADQLLTVTVKNYSNRPVDLAFARENGYNTSDNLTKGWYTVQANSEKTIRVVKYNPNDNYYYLLRYFNGNMTRSRDFFGWITIGRAFTSQNGRKLGGGMRVGFKVLKQNRGRATITINK